MKFIYNDGGRAAAGYKGAADGCVCRAIAIASGRPYQEVYDRLADINASFRGGRKTRGARHVRTARAGMFTRSSAAFRRYMTELGFAWTATMRIGSGCKVHLRASELPSGRIVAAVSKHYVAVIDGVAHDTHDPRRFAFDGLDEHEKDDGVSASRCVYGYWQRA